MTVTSRRLKLSSQTSPTTQISLAIAPSSASTNVSTTTDAVVTLTRTNYAGAVTLSAENLPSGVTASFSVSVLSGATLTSTVTFTVSGGASVATNSITIRGTGVGIVPATTSFSLTVTNPVTPTIAISDSPSSGSGAQGGFTTSIITLVRGGSYTGTVTLSVDSLPANVTVGFSPPTLSGGTLTSMMTLTVGASATVATTLLTVRATGSGVTDATCTFNLSVVTTGFYEFLRPIKAELPRSSAFGPGMTFNATTGMIEGTSVDTSYPGYSDTVVFTDTGDALQNMVNLDALMHDMHVDHPISVNTRIRIPNTCMFSGQFACWTYTGPYWIIVEPFDTTVLPPLPADGIVRATEANRMTFDYLGSNSIPTFDTRLQGGSDYIGSYNIACDFAASKVYIRGIKLRNPNNYTISYMAAIFPPLPGSTTPSEYPSSIILNQCLFDGGSDAKTSRGVCMGGNGLACVNSGFQNIGYGLPGNTADSQCFFVVNGSGPYKVANNDANMRWGSGECYMSGGTPANGSTNAFIPKDIEITGNYFWHTGEGGDKNNIEIKFGIRTCIDGNYCGYSNGGNQQINCLFRQTDQFGPNTSNLTSDIVFMNNYLTNTPNGLGLTGSNEGYSGTEQMNGLHIMNNLVAGLYYMGGQQGDTVVWGGANFRNVDVKYNTFIGRQDGGTYYGRCQDVSGYASPAMGDVANQYNVMVGEDGGAKIGLLSCSAGPPNYGEPVWNNATTGTSPFNNNFINFVDGTYYPSQFSAANIAAMKFIDFPVGNLRLASDSPGYHTGPNGQDYGCQFDVFNAVIARAGGP